MSQVFMIAGNHVLWAGVLAWFIAQTLKVLLTLLLHGHFDSSRFWGSGGMPSSHSALMCAVATTVGFQCGFDSPTFALAVCFAFVVMYDAMGVRRAAGKQAAVLNRVVDEVFYQGKELNQERLKELIGHTPIQVIAGALLGVMIGIIVG